MQTTVIRKSSSKLAAAALVVGLLALSIGGYSAYKITFPPPKIPPHIIYYEIKVTTFAVNNVTTRQSGTGNTFLVEGTLFPRGQAGFPALAIGNYTCFGTYSNSNLALQLLWTTRGGNGGEGQIVADGPGPGTPNINYTGVIIGGTGNFAGAQGTYLQYINPDHTFMYYTMNVTSTA